MKKIMLIFTSLLILFTVGCTVKEDGIVINGAKDISVGDILKLSTEITNQENATISGITWASTNENVLTVSRSGEVVGISFGTAQVSATMDIGDISYTDKVYINVGNSSGGTVADGIKIINNETIATGDTLHLNYEIINKNNAAVTDINWKSSNALATIDNEGVVKAVSSGISTITLTLKIGGVEYKDEVTIMITATSSDQNSVKITGAKNIYIGESVELSTTITNPNNLAVNDASWSVNNDFVTINDEGVVTSKKVGDSTITFTVRIGNKTYSDSVMIKVLEESTGEDDTNIYLKEPKVETSEPKVNEKVELSYSESTAGYIETNYNPYDYEQIQAVATIVDSNNNVQKVPLYWAYDETIALVSYSGSITGNNGVPSTDSSEMQGKETYYYDKNAQYFLRFNPTTAGDHRVIMKLSIEGKTVETITTTVNVVENNEEKRGVIKVDTTNNRTLIDENNNTFISNGMNHAWYTSSSRGAYDYDVWFADSSANNINTTRIWMADWGMTMRNSNEYNNFSKSTGADRIDHILQQAEENNIYIQLTLNHHGQFTEYTNTVWSNNAYNTKNGGMLDKPYDFFSNEEAKAAYKNELMYIIARYGYSDNILAWELFNEVDYTYHVDYSNKIPVIGDQLEQDVKNWHEEMGEFIKDNDTYGHMVTTSYKASTGPAFELEVIDYTNIHNYGFYETSGYWKNDVNSLLDQMPKEASTTTNKYNKPVFHSEVGVNYENGPLTAKEDPNALSIHQSLYAGFLGGGIGGGMQWWWDSWIHPNDLYSKYSGAAQYANMLDLTGSDYTAVTHGSSTVTSSSGDLHMFGYLFEDRSYGYVYDSNYNHWSTNSNNMTSQSLVLSIATGDYTIQYFEPQTNKLLSTSDVSSSNGKLTLNLPTFNNEITYILTKK